MSQEFNPDSRTHDLFGAGLGLLALIVLISIPWNVDASGPDPFYKGPLIFPIIVLTIMMAASVPAFARLFRPIAGAIWTLDGQGWPIKTAVVLMMLIAALAGIIVIGMEASSLLFLLIALRYLGQTGWLRGLVIPVLVAGTIVIVFKYFLGVFFPEPLMMQWFFE